MGQGYEETIKWYDENAPQYAKKSIEHSSIDKKQLDEFSSLIPAGGKVLDAGCGAGRDTNLFQEKGFDAIGLDISKNIIKAAQNSFPNARFIEGDILYLPFQNNTFDAVWAHAAIVHFDKDKQIKKALSEFFRTLKQNGVIHVLVRAREKAGKKSEFKEDSISGQERYYRNFTKNELEEFLSNSGFNNINITQYNESELDPNKRPGENIEWLLALAEKS